jgi:GT2 family glycosyltransferase
VTVSKKSISVILPNFNGKDLLEEFIPSIIEALQFSNLEYEFIVIDDHSTDNSVAFIQQQFPFILVLENEINSGFSYSCNRGIQLANNDLVFLVNSDVKLSLNYFENQLHYFDTNDTFGVMGQIKNYYSSKTEDTARFPKFKGVKLKATTFYYATNPTDEIFTTYLSGANALICSRKLKFLKGFDEIYSPFYFEDFDLGLRAWKMGWKLFYEHQSICFHKVSATTNKIDKSNLVKKTYYRNSFILHAIHLKGFRKLAWYSQLVTTTLLWHLIKGEFWILYSLIDFFKHKKQIQKSIDQLSKLQLELNRSIEVDTILTIFKNSLHNKSIKWV